MITPKELGRKVREAFDLWDPEEVWGDPKVTQELSDRPNESGDVVYLCRFRNGSVFQYVPRRRITIIEVGR